MIGKSLSHFKITAKLGEGGMGEVYRAEVTKLGRGVAIKVLPEAVAGDPERLARFEREAKVLASLNHPNIAGIYQVEEDAGVHFLVMELVEGEDLTQRLERGAILVEEALPIALQIAEALEAAHEKGIIHRDLKPANVKVTPDGQVKVLDFGLAKALDADRDFEGVGANLSLSPTLTAEMTGAGVILGTAAYMSPEQARGQAVDKRADVWAYAVLVWEMLTGERLFAGDTVTDTLAAVVTKEPDMTALPESTPLEIRHLLARCLRKDPRRRLPDVGAARLELEDLLQGGVPSLAHPDSDQPKALGKKNHSRARELMAWVLALVATGLAVASLLNPRREQAASSPTVLFGMDPPHGGRFQTEWDWPVPSPDGRRVVFRVLSGGEVVGDESSALWVRSLDSQTARRLVGTERASGVPAWSPDENFLLFEIDGEVQRLRVADGSIQRLTAIPGSGPLTPAWGTAGTILFSRMETGSVIHSVAETGGEAVQLTALDASGQETSHLFPQFLPDGQRFLFQVGPAEGENAGLYMASLEDPGQRQKLIGGFGRRPFVDNHILFGRDGNLYAQVFDPDSPRLAGEPIAIASQIPVWGYVADVGWFGASPGGTLAYISSAGQTGQMQLSWRDRSGQQLETLGEPGFFGQIALSPDGRNVALEIGDEGEFDLWVMEVARGVMSRVTVNPGEERDPVWSPDGRSLAYVWRTLDGAALLRKGLRVSDPETVLMDSPDEDVPESWSLNGETIMVVRRTAEDEQSVWALSVSEGGDARPVLNTGFRIDEPQISPNGQWLAYVSQESGNEEVYLESFDEEGERLRVSLKGGGQPKWRADSQELFFVTLEGVLMAVDVGTRDGRLEVSLPTRLFQIASIEGMGYDDYAVNDDGTRFLVKVPIGGDVERKLQIISNWTGLLETR